VRAKNLEAPEAGRRGPNPGRGPPRNPEAGQASPFRPPMEAKRLRCIEQGEKPRLKSSSGPSRSSQLNMVLENPEAPASGLDRPDETIVLIRYDQIHAAPAPRGESCLRDRRQILAWPIPACGLEVEGHTKHSSAADEIHSAPYPNRAPPPVRDYLVQKRAILESEPKRNPANGFGQNPPDSLERQASRPPAESRVEASSLRPTRNSAPAQVWSRPRKSGQPL